ncbi:MAG TPA: hypothetical protein VKB89_05860 [Xanthobacteraceae bacterium]|nr:hypothetical protein [Xanthobacteraceae bacterium]
MSTGSKGWSAKLTRTIVLKDGTTLATLADVRAFILKEPNTSKSAVLGSEPPS